MKIGPFLFLLGSLQFLISMLIAESIYPGYDRLNNYISDLGIGANTSTIFNSSVILLGILIILGSILILDIIKKYNKLIFLILASITGMGAIGVGIFVEGTPYHGIFALIAFLFGSITILYSSFLFNKIKIISIILGVISLISLFLFIIKFQTPLGMGGIERLIVYPQLAWSIILGVSYIK
jgi:hypothetical membrane protein